MSNNETVSVSRTDLESICEHFEFGRHWQAMQGVQKLRALLAAPVPPAGGEPEVFLVVKHGPVGSDGLPEWVLAQSPGNAPWDIDNIADGTELVDRAHVTRLQAEVETLRAALRTEVEAGDSWKREAQDLREERDILAARVDNLDRNSHGIHALGTIEKLRSELDALKAAQGEPVAVMYEDGSVLTKAECGTGFDICCKVETPLYASPPAPVAVVLPERITAEHVELCLGGVRAAPTMTLGQCDALAQLLNACIAEVTILNHGEKP